MLDLWIQVEVGLPTSKLVDRACEALGLDDDQVIGKLVKLWLAVMEEGCHGRIGERTDRWIEHAVDWRGEPGKFAAFVRQHHLDENGVIREWLEKYGSLEAQRAEGARVKREQRKRIAQERERRLDEESDRPPERPVDKGVDNPVDRPAGGPVDPSAFFNLQSGSALSSKNGKESLQGESASSWRILPATSQPDAFARQYKLRGKWGDTITGFVRSSRDGLAVMSELENHLTGEMGYKKVEPDLLGFALSQYCAAGHGADGRLNSALFAGFVRRGAGKVALNREQQHIDREKDAEAERVREDEAAAAKKRALVSSFEEDHPDRYIELEQQADGMVDKNHVRGRGILVRAKLVELITAEVGRAR